MRPVQPLNKPLLPCMQRALACVRRMQQTAQKRRIARGKPLDIKRLQANDKDD